MPPASHSINTGQIPWREILDTDFVDEGPCWTTCGGGHCCNVDIPGVTQRIELYNYIAQDYEMIDVRVATDTDTVAEIVVDGDPSRFIHSESLEMKAQLTWQPGPVFIFPWSTNIDQAVWGVIP